jgi:hypothetical protein
MHQLELLNLPPIPQTLLEDTQVIIEKTEFATSRKHVSDELFSYLQEMFKDPITVCYAVIRYGIAPHKDVEGREVGYNFVINTGGSHAVTTMYDDDLNVLQEMVCSQGRWYKLPGGSWHSIHGIEPGQHRVLVSVTYLHDLGFNPKGQKLHPKASQSWLWKQNQALFDKFGVVYSKLLGVGSEI